MVLLCFLFLLTGIAAYEHINVFSDTESIITVERNDGDDTATATSKTRVGISYKGYSNPNITHPEGLEEFRFVITDPTFNKGRYALKVPFEGVHIAMKLDKQRPLSGLCPIFDALLPCFRVKQCNSTRIHSQPNSTVESHSVYDIDLDQAIWTPTYLVPYSVLKPTTIGNQES